MIREIFSETADDARLEALLKEARGQGAAMAMLPELPMLPWRPAFQEAHDEDGEPLQGRTLARLSRAARHHEIALLGGAIVIDAATKLRHNTALLIDAGGCLVATYRKLHLPCEPGFWESHHYTPADDPPEPIEGFPLRLGIQLCSDINRPAGSHILCSMGAEALLCPRATEAATFERWRLMLRANALAGCAYVLSVTRPRPEFEVPLGGPSIAIAPDGEVVVETEDTLVTVELKRERVERCRAQYPGYLPVRAELYARGWQRAAG